MVKNELKLEDLNEEELNTFYFILVKPRKSFEILKFVKPKIVRKHKRKNPKIKNYKINSSGNQYLNRKNKGVLHRLKKLKIIYKKIKNSKIEPYEINFDRLIELFSEDVKYKAELKLDEQVESIKKLKEVIKIKRNFFNYNLYKEDFENPPNITSFINICLFNIFYQNHKLELRSGLYSKEHPHIKGHEGIINPINLILKNKGIDLDKEKFKKLQKRVENCLLLVLYFEGIATFAVGNVISSIFGAGIPIPVSKDELTNLNNKFSFPYLDKNKEKKYPEKVQLYKDISDLIPYFKFYNRLTRLFID